MQTAAVFKSGNSQAVRLPKKFQLQSKRVSIERKGNTLILREVPMTMAELLAKLPIIPDAPLDHEDGIAEPVEIW